MWQICIWPNRDTEEISEYSSFTWFETDLTNKKRFSHSKNDFVTMFTNLFCKICFFRQMKLKIRNIFVRTFWRHESWSDQKRSWSVTLLLCTYNIGHGVGFEPSKSGILYIFIYQNESIPWSCIIMI